MKACRDKCSEDKTCKAWFEGPEYTCYHVKSDEDIVGYKDRWAVE